MAGAGPSPRAPQAPPHAARPAGRPRRPPPRRRGLGLAGWLALIAGGLTAAGVAGAVALSIFAPTDIVRDQIVRQVRAKTGRDLAIAGPTSLSFYPALAVTMRDVTLSAPPGMSGPPTLTMRALDATLPIWPLLKREVVVDRLVLHEPVLDLVVDAAGRRSWDFARLELPDRKVRLAQLAPPAGGRAGAPKPLPAELEEFVRNASDPAAAGKRGGALGALGDLELRDVRVEQASVRYHDQRSGVREEVTRLNLDLALRSLASPLTTSGEATYRTERITFEGRVQSLAALVSEQPTAVTVRLAGRVLVAAFDGTAALRAAPELEGPLTLKSPSSAALATWLGTPLPEPMKLGALALTARLKAAGPTYALSDLEASLAPFQASGTLAVDTSGPRPAVRANLRMAELDLNQVLALADAAAQAPPRRPAAASPPGQRASEPPTPSAPAGRPAPKSIEDLLKEGDGDTRPGAKVKGFTQRNGWSDETIDLAALGLVDLDARLVLGRVAFRDLKLGQTQATVALKSRVLRANIDEMQLYGGRGRAIVTLDASGAQGVLGANISAEDVAALPILKDAAAFDWIAGKGRLSLALAGQGTTQRQIAQTLNGKGDFAFTDGAIVGINIPQILRGLTQGKLSGLDRVPTEKTDFSELAASFVVDKGVARNQDLRLVSPLVRLGGAGTVDLGGRTLDYTARPRLVASLTGQGGGATLPAGLEVPIRITGPWDKPKVAPDIDGVMKNPDQVIDTIKNVAKQFKGKSPEEITRSLLGSGGEGGAAGGGGNLKPRDLLNQLLGKPK